MTLAREIKKQVVATVTTNSKKDWLLKFMQKTMSQALRNFYIKGTSYETMLYLHTYQGELSLT